MNDHCRWTRLHLARFIDGELPAAEKITLEEHLDACSACRELLAHMSLADDAARDASLQTPDDALRDASLQTPESEKDFEALLGRMHASYDLAEAARLREREMAGEQHGAEETDRRMSPMSAEEAASAPLEAGLRQGESPLPAAERRGLGRLLAGWFTPSPTWRWASIASAAAAMVIVTIVLVSRNPEIPIESQMRGGRSVEMPTVALPKAESPADESPTADSPTMTSGDAGEVESDAHDDLEIVDSDRRDHVDIAVRDRRDGVEAVALDQSVALDEADPDFSVRSETEAGASADKPVGRAVNAQVGEDVTSIQNHLRGFLAIADAEVKAGPAASAKLTAEYAAGSAPAPERADSGLRESALSSDSSRDELRRLLVRTEWHLDRAAEERAYVTGTTTANEYRGTSVGAAVSPSLLLAVADGWYELWENPVGDEARSAGEGAGTAAGAEEAGAGLVEHGDQRVVESAGTSEETPAASGDNTQESYARRALIAYGRVLDTDRNLGGARETTGIAAVQTSSERAREKRGEYDLKDASAESSVSETALLTADERARVVARIRQVQKSIEGR